MLLEWDILVVLMDIVDTDQDLRAVLLPHGRDLEVVVGQLLAFQLHLNWQLRATVIHGNPLFRTC